MKKRGFDTQEIAGKLHEKGIEVKPPTLAKYLNEFRRKWERKPDTPATQKREKNPQADAVKPMDAKTEVGQAQARTPGSIVIRPDTPIDEL